MAGLAEGALRVADTTDLPVVGLVAVTRVDDDGADTPSGRLQQVQATIFQVKHDLRRWQVVGVLSQIEEFRQLKIWRKLIERLRHPEIF